MSGMLKALEVFINHLSYANQYDRIQEINFQGTRIVYERLGSVMAVGISKKVNEEQEHYLLNYLLSEFIEQYRDYIPNEGGNMAPFQPFRHRLQRFEQEAIQNGLQVKTAANFHGYSGNPFSINSMQNM